MRQQRPSERNALPLAAGELLHAALQKRLETEQLHDEVQRDALLDAACALLGVTQIAERIEMRKQPRVLEHVADAALLGGQARLAARVFEYTPSISM